MALLSEHTVTILTFPERAVQQTLIQIDSTGVHVDELKAIRAFVQVGKQQSFSAAAKHLGRDQSVINRQVTALEERLGRQLVSRRGKVIELTDDGLTYFRYAAQALEAFDRAEECMGKPPARKQEMVCLSTSPVFASVLVLPRLQEMRRTLGGVELTLSTLADSAGNDAQVLRVSVDYVSGSVSSPAHVLGPHEWVLMANAEVATRLKSRSVERGVRSPLDLLMLGEDRDRGPWFLVRGGTRVQVASRVRLTTDKPSLLLEAAVLGHGIALVPWWVALQEGASGVVPLFPEWQLEPALGPAQLVATFEGRVRGSESLPRVVDFLIGALKGLRPQKPAHAKLNSYRPRTPIFDPQL